MAVTKGRLAGAGADQRQDATGMAKASATLASGTHGLGTASAAEAAAVGASGMQTWLDNTCSSSKCGTQVQNTCPSTLRPHQDAEPAAPASESTDTGTPAGTSGPPSQVTSAPRSSADEPASTLSMLSTQGNVRLHSLLPVIPSGSLVLATEGQLTFSSRALSMPSDAGAHDQAVPVPDQHAANNESFALDASLFMPLGLGQLRACGTYSRRASVVSAGVTFANNLVSVDGGHAAATAADVCLGANGACDLDRQPTLLERQGTVEGALSARTLSGSRTTHNTPSEASGATRPLSTASSSSPTPSPRPSGAVSVKSKVMRLLGLRSKSSGAGSAVWSHANALRRQASQPDMSVTVQAGRSSRSSMPKPAKKIVSGVRAVLASFSRKSPAKPKGAQQLPANTAGSTTAEASRHTYSNQATAAMQMSAMQGVHDSHYSSAGIIRDEEAVGTLGALRGEGTHMASLFDTQTPGQTGISLTSCSVPQGNTSEASSTPQNEPWGAATGDVPHNMHASHGRMQSGVHHGPAAPTSASQLQRQTVPSMVHSPAVSEPRKVPTRASIELVQRAVGSTAQRAMALHRGGGSSTATGASCHRNVELMGTWEDELMSQVRVMIVHFKMPFKQRSTFEPGVRLTSAMNRPAAGSCSVACCHHGLYFLLGLLLVIDCIACHKGTSHWHYPAATCYNTCENSPV